MSDWPINGDFTYIQMPREYTRDDSMTVLPMHCDIIEHCRNTDASPWWNAFPIAPCACSWYITWYYCNHDGIYPDYKILQSKHASVVDLYIQYRPIIRILFMTCILRSITCKKAICYTLYRIRSLVVECIIYYIIE